MEFSIDHAAHADAIAALFEASFSASEGAAEGALIADLVRRLMTQTPAGDLRVFTAWQETTLLGGIFFTRLAFAGDPRRIFLLAPVAVAPDQQGRGVGQRLISHGLAGLRTEGVDGAVTYGDPAFYGRVGFAAVREADLPAPHRLGQPEGWLAQSLTSEPLGRVRGPARCVAAFDDPALW